MLAVQFIMFDQLGQLFLRPNHIGDVTQGQDHNPMINRPVNAGVDLYVDTPTRFRQKLSAEFTKGARP